MSRPVRFAATLRRGDPMRTVNTADLLSALRASHHQLTTLAGRLGRLVPPLLPRSTA
jgi:hypothetical protein